MLMKGSLCGTPEAAAAFLRQLAAAVGAVARTELEALEEIQRRQQQRGGQAGSSEEGVSGGIDGWDLERLLTTATSQGWGGRGQATATWSDFSDYFTLKSLLEVNVMVVEVKALMKVYIMYDPPYPQAALPMLHTCSTHAPHACSFVGDRSSIEALHGPRVGSGALL